MLDSHNVKPFRERSNIIWRFEGEEVCSICQSAVIWGERGLAKSSYNYGAEKVLKAAYSSALFTVYVGELVENVIWGDGSKIAQKIVIWYLNVPLIILACEYKVLLIVCLST